MLQVTNLQFHYPESGFQLSLPSWMVPEGEQAALIGPSGSGKTTLLSLLAGILQPEAGEIELLGKPLHQMSETERRNLRISQCGLIFQSFELIPYLNVVQNIQLPYYLNPVLERSSDVEFRAYQLAEQLGLSSYLQNRVTSLSVGEQQRLAICRALITQPQVILADEPTASLDQTNAERVMDVLFEYSREQKAMLIMSTHDPALFTLFEHRLDFASLVSSPV
ncbi:MAG: ATP-binding cassette domain-containing protein [Planctomycetaceae bacterium]|nr:ATP-binding cassette domain-containing protein [Planctomycetaceae bacterium]